MFNHQSPSLSTFRPGSSQALQLSAISGVIPRVAMVTTQNVPDSRTSYFKLNCCRVFWLKTELVITCDRTVRTQPLSWDSHLLKHSLMTLLPGEQYRAAEAPVRPLARPRPAPGGQAAPRPRWGQSSRPRPGWGRQPGPSHQTRQPWLSLSVCRPCQCSLSSAIVFCLTSLHRWSFSLSCLSSVPTSSMLVWLNSSWRPSNLHHIISNCNVTLINWRCCCCLVLLDNFNLFSSLLSCISLVLYPPLSYISCLTSPHYLFPFQEARLITWLDHWLHPKVDSYSNITQCVNLSNWRRIRVSFGHCLCVSRQASRAMFKPSPSNGSSWQR